MRFYFFLVLVTLAIWGVGSWAACFQPLDEVDPEVNRLNARTSLVWLVMILAFWMFVGFLLTIGVPGFTVFCGLVVSAGVWFVYKIIKIARS